MSVGKTEKAKHYTSPQTHTDEDGQLRNFTMIDHSVKTTIGGSVKLNQEELDNMLKERHQWKKDVCDRILAISASLCPLDKSEYTIRGKDQAIILWNETMIKDEGFDPIQRLFLCTILENRMEMLKKNM